MIFTWFAGHARLTLALHWKFSQVDGFLDEA
jgi:hypothetical protein